jgi:hypothetical protein
MPWRCYSCGTKNPNKSDTCEACGGNVAAPRSFYLHWVLGGAAFFLVTYLVGTFIGGTLVELSVTPDDATILAAARANGVKAESAMALKPEEAKEARDAIIAKAKLGMSPAARYFLHWFLPAILFAVCGAIVGFVSDGRTIVEAGLGSIVGQAVGFILMVHAFGHEIGWISLVIGLAVGCGLAVFGAWLGEGLQDRRERGR